jgi:hypothetical protein
LDADIPLSAKKVLKEYRKKRGKKAVSQQAEI